MKAIYHIKLHLCVTVTFLCYDIILNNIIYYGSMVFHRLYHGVLENSMFCMHKNKLDKLCRIIKQLLFVNRFIFMVLNVCYRLSGAKCQIIERHSNAFHTIYYNIVHREYIVLLKHFKITIFNFTNKPNHITTLDFLNNGI